METRILNGTPYRDRIFSGIKQMITASLAGSGERPGITFIAMTGHEPLMKYTIGLHEQAAGELGFKVVTETLPCDAPEESLLEIVDRLNADDSVHAIVLLQPMPKHINATRVISHIDPLKEVEGFHPGHLASLLAGDVRTIRYPMVLPTALVELFNETGLTREEGTSWVFVADDEFFLRPFTNMVVKTACPQVVPPLCSITILNKNSVNLASQVRSADYLFVISKCPGYIRAEWLKPGVCIVDVYSNLVDEVPSKKNPGVILPVIRGGVNVNEVDHVAGAIAPCPGGLMPAVLAVLFSNAMKAFFLSKNVKTEDLQESMHS